ncbi:alpha-2-macroglobulin [Hyphomicrobium methylovorum]|uniref:alpha-2-macroglobulin family protein n=1 Tax=Hyphomicrobium methylovorum TaxID=84 RepID=UPI0015E6EE71|nr:alpha-2-macroglobulin [Hyphomicrobium methylovorum]MBA2126468.1 alpha-2-macroglobulin [Hyphomicrobium methylovorum]
MLFLARFVLATSLLLIAPTFAASAADKTFAHQGIAADAKRYETFLKANWKSDGRTPAALKAEAEKTFVTDPRAASRNLANAVALNGQDGAAWTRLAEALLAIKPDPQNTSERYDLQIYASGAAYRGYERAANTADKAHALSVLGDALKGRSYWRPAIDALKLSLELADNQKTRETYDKLRAEYGFRVTDYKTDNEATPPRLCLQFSEDLSRTQSDVAKFVSVNGKDPQNLVQEGKQLCVEGLKHGDRYVVQVRAGLPSDLGETLLKTSDMAVYVPDRSPFVRFSGKAYVLPSRGQQGIPVVTTNTSKIEVEVYRIGDRSLATTLQSGDMQRQLSSYDVENIRDRTGVKVYAGEMDIASKLNEDVTTAVPVTEATGKLEPGVYVVVAKPTEKTKTDSYERATQWFIVSDLGLTAFTGGDGVHAFVRSLSDATATPGTTVKLVARNNELLATAKTDEHGHAKFDAAITKGDGGAAPAILIAEKGEGEFAFLDLTLNAFDLSDRGVSGRDPAGPVDAFVYTERGVYRGGEEVNITGLVRDQFGKASTVPTTLIVSRPDGVEQTRVVMNDQGLGGRSLTLPLAKTAMTGTWRLWLHTDPKAPAIAQRSFLVEDFVPERLDMKLSADVPALTPEESRSIKADGRYLYGPPAAALGLEGEVVVRASNKQVPGYAGYVFGQADEFVNPARQPLEANLAMDKDGKASIPIVLPQMARTPKPLEAAISVKLREAGGRTIERNLTLPVDLKIERIGIKPLFENMTAPEDQNAGFDVVMLNKDNKPEAASNLTWTLTRLDTNWQWYRRDGSWTYDAVTVKRKVGSGSLSTTADGPVQISQSIGWGRYRLDVASNDANGPASSVIFNAGWYTSGDAIDSPEQLDVALDKESYKSGDTAKLRIASKLGGRALVTVLGTGMHETKEVDIPKGGGEVDVPVSDAWGPGAYVTALLYRPMDEAQKRMPSRAIGIRWLPVDQSGRQLKVDVTLLEKVKSAAKVTVPLKVEGLAPGEPAHVVVAAVDLGILNLTRYETPAPEAWFNQQQKLAFEIRDFYGRLIDGMRADRGKLKSGGDAGAPVMQGNPTVETVVSLYSGIVDVQADGTASVDFELPDFNGTVRVMAVAWSKDKVGHGSGDLIVRDAVALTVAVPRFMTLGDEMNLGFDIHNVDGPDAAYKLSLARKDGDDKNETLTAISEQTLDLKAGARSMKRIPFKPQDLGRLTLRATVTGPNDIAVKREMTFEVLPPAGDIKRTTVSSLKANGGKLSVSADLAQDLIPSRTRINVSVGPAARLDVPTLLARLDRYPYGCAEQTVSRALPLIVANSVAADVGIAADSAIKERVQTAVARVFEMQDSSGAFGVWGPSNADLWLTAYVTDFLTRAKEASYTVPREGFNRALDRLQNFIAYASDFEKGGEDRAYALYVLARNGRAPVGDLRYYADERIERFSTPLAKAQLGAALAMMGDKERAERAFKSALAALPDATPDTGYRRDYGSTLRDGAALVALAAESGIARDQQPRLANVIAKAYETRSYTSTQEQAWMLLAAKALNDDVKGTKLTVDGKPVTGPLLRGLKPAELKDGALTITNSGDAAVDAVISVIGAALTPEPAASKGFKIERQAYTLDGKKVDLKSLGGGKSDVKQNDRFVITVKVTSDEAAGRVMVVDHLPAGFEIENPHLVDSGSISGLNWLKSTSEPEHTEFRDDRFVAAFNFSNVRAGRGDPENASEEAEGEGGSENDAVVMPDGTAQKMQPVSTTLAYIVRAVNPGTFVHPAATVEDMYRPDRYARTAAGTLTVSAKE